MKFRADQSLSSHEQAIGEVSSATLPCRRPTPTEQPHHDGTSEQVLSTHRQGHQRQIDAASTIGQARNVLTIPRRTGEVTSVTMLPLRCLGNDLLVS